MPPKLVQFVALLACAALLYGAAYCSLGASSSYGGMAAAVALISFAEAVADPAIVAVATSLAPAEAMGRYLGFYGMLRALAHSLGPYLGMQYYALTGSSPLVYWGIFGGFATVAAVGFAVLPGGRALRASSVTRG